ncbi:hypothetical protein EQVG_00403 [Emiliania huxleyi virus 207]|nr:hypothetical protein ELVG_00412 [Emiliania huxleyi virus 203]AEP15812.1 hypothetical protein EQVG_00403 [Emiliania huxleyi virus 207]AEP16185.1 hypothetical protein ERVG_00310 [Emiliania huxleyi virus 208]
MLIFLVMTILNGIRLSTDRVVTKHMSSTQMEPVSEFVSVYDRRIVRGSTVFLKYDYEQRAYGCTTANVIQPGTASNLYCSLFIRGFHQPVFVPYHAISFDRLF